MGRTIPSFRQLLEIERSSWSFFKKELPSKPDKKAFDKIFENAELYTSYLSNAVNPITLESVIMGSLFHNYKILLEIGKEKERDNFCDDITRENELKLKLLKDTKPQGKLLFDRTCKKWKGMVDSLHKDDMETLVKMVLEVCSYNDESCNKNTNDKDSKSCITCLFFISLLILQQKTINRIGKDGNIDNEMKHGKDVSLLDFMVKE